MSAGMFLIFFAVRNAFDMRIIVSLFHVQRGERARVQFVASTSLSTVLTSMRFHKVVEPMRLISSCILFSNSVLARRSSNEQHSRVDLLHVFRAMENVLSEKVSNL